MKQIQILCEAKLNLPEKSAADQGEPTGKIEARVTTWGKRVGEDGRKFNYQPEGFMKWAQEFSDKGRPLPMFVNHQADAMPVGEWTEFEFDDTGMTAKGRMFLNTTAGSDLYQIMTESPAMFGGVSVGAYAEDYRWVDDEGNEMMDDDDCLENGFFQITQGGLQEVSVVMHPNNPQAEIHKLEFFRPDGSCNLKAIETILREAGLSRKDAVTSASKFKLVLQQRDVVVQSLDHAPKQGDLDAEVTEAELLAALEHREIIRVLNQKLKG